jgi:DnaB-like helicase N terminal domain/AAA domain
MTTAAKNGKAKGRINPEILDRQPPRDLDAEKGVLGSVLLKPEILSEIAAILRPRDFYDEAHEKLFATMRTIDAAGQRVDLTLLANRLHAANDFDSIGGAGYLTELSRSVPDAANAKHYAGIVREKAGLRRIILGASEALRGAYSELPVGDVEGQLRGTLEDLPAREALPSSISTLIAENPNLAEPIIDGIARCGETINIIAPPKVGKSWLAYQLALTVAIGGDWLGRFECKPGRVLLIDNELHPATLAHRIPSSAYAVGVRQDDYSDRLDVLSLRGRLTDLYGIARALEKIEPGRYVLIILDALYRALPDGMGENDNASMAALFNLIDRLTQRLCCAWLNIHHSSKGEQGQKSIVDVGAGAGSQSRAADAHIVLRPHEEEGAVVLEAVVRSFKPIDPLPLRWTFPVWTPDVGLDPAAVSFPA